MGEIINTSSQVIWKWFVRYAEPSGGGGGFTEPNFGRGRAILVKILNRTFKHVEISD